MHGMHLGMAGAALLCAATIPTLLGARCGPVDPIGERLIGQRAFEVDDRFDMMHHVPIRMGGSPGPEVNAGSGNLFLEIPLLDHPNPAHAFPIGLAYNSCPAEACAGWRLSFDLRVEGGFFTDATGARHWIGDHRPGDPIAGTGMIFDRLDGANPELRSQSGWLHRFGSDGLLVLVRPRMMEYPHLRLLYQETAEGRRLDRIVLRERPLVTRELYEVEYDAAGHVGTIRDGAGRSVHLAWSGGGKLLSIHLPNDANESGPVGEPSLHFGYASGRLERYGNREGNSLRFAYEEGRVASVVQLGESGAVVDPTHSFSYAGSRTTWIDPLGTRFELDFDDGQLVRFENTATGSSRAWSWVARRPVGFEENGVSTSFGWSRDRLTSVHAANGNHSTFVHSHACLDPEAFSLDTPVRGAVDRPPVARASDSLGSIRELDCDELGRPVAYRNGEGEETRMRFHLDGLSISSLRRPEGVETSLHAFTPTGHATQVSGGGAWLPNQIRTINDYGQVEQGSPVGRLDLGDVQSREFDLEGRLVAVVLRDGSRYDLAHRGDGLLTRIERPGGGDHRFSYDALGWLSRVEERVGEDWVVLEQYRYDALGRVTRVERANGSVTETVRDGDGHPVSVRNLWGEEVESWAILSYEGGRLRQRMDSTSQPVWPEFYEYDEAGRLVGTVHPDGRATRLTRDLRGRVVSKEFVDPFGEPLRKLGFEYDLADRRVRTCDGPCGEGVLLVEREITNGVVSEIRYGNGVRRTLDYDHGSLVQTNSHDANGTRLEETRLDYRRGLYIHSDSSIEFETTTWGGVEATTREHYSFVHNRLDCVKIGDGGQRCFEFDGHHNLTAELGPDGVATMTRHYNGTGNRLVSVSREDGSTDSHAYDASGHRVQHGATPIVWTAHGRPASIGTDHELVWNATGRLLERRVGGVTTSYQYDGSVRAVDGAHRIEDEDFSLDLQTGEARYRHKDNRGNVKFVTDADGTVVAHLSYGAFGLREIFGLDQAFHFVGQEELAPGLMLLGARLYDGYSFLSPDPFLQLFCQYCYTFADPVNWSDETGLTPTGGEVLNYVGVVAGGVGAIASTGVLGATMLVAAPPLIAFGAGMVLVGASIQFFGSEAWSDGKFDGPGNGSGGSSPAERAHQCLCYAPSGGGLQIDWEELEWVEGLFDAINLGGLMIARVESGLVRDRIPSPGREEIRNA